MSPGERVWWAQGIGVFPNDVESQDRALGLHSSAEVQVWVLGSNSSQLRSWALRMLIPCQLLGKGGFILAGGEEQLLLVPRGKGAQGHGCGHFHRAISR